MRNQPGTSTTAPGRTTAPSSASISANAWSSVDRRLGQDVERALGHRVLVAEVVEDRAHPVAPPLERADVDRQLLEVLDRVLQVGVRERVAGRELGEQDPIPERRPVGHRRRHGQVADPHARRQQRLPVRVGRRSCSGRPRPGCGTSGRRRRSGCTARRRPGRSGGRSAPRPRQHVGERLQVGGGVDPAARVVRRVDQDGPGARRDRVVDRRRGRGRTRAAASGTRTGTPPAARISSS